MFQKNYNLRSFVMISNKNIKAVAGGEGISLSIIIIIILYAKLLKLENNDKKIDALKCYINYIYSYKLDIEYQSRSA